MLVFLGIHRAWEKNFDAKAQTASYINIVLGGNDTVIFVEDLETTEKTNSLVIPAIPQVGNLMSMAPMVHSQIFCVLDFRMLKFEKNP